MKLGFSTWSVQRLPLTAALREAARVGYDGVEIAVNPGWTGQLDDLDPAARREVRALLDDTDLELASLVSGHRNQLADRGEFDQGKVRFARELDLALEWFRPPIVPVMNLSIGGVSAKWEDQKYELIDRMAETVALAAARQVVIAFEPQVARAIDRPERMLWAVDQINSPFCRVNLDIAHFSVQGMAIERIVAALAPLSAHAHLPDYRGRAPDHQFAIPGEGETDYDDYFRAMDRHCYRGYVSVEISLMVQRRSKYDPISAMEQAYQTLRTAMDRVGIVSKRPFEEIDRDSRSSDPPLRKD